MRRLRRSVAFLLAVIMIFGMTVSAYADGITDVDVQVMIGDEITDVSDNDVIEEDTTVVSDNDSQNVPDFVEIESAGNNELLGSNPEGIADESLFTWDGNVITGYLGAQGTNLIIPARATAIGDEAFRNDYFQSVSFEGNNVTIIGKYAFAGTALRSVTLPDSLITIDKYAFAASTLTEIVIPANVTKICEGAFSIRENPENYYSDIGHLKTVTFAGNNLVSIGDLAFYYQNIESIAFPDSLTIIGERAFYSSGLKSVTLSANIQLLGSYCFGNCSLDSVFIDCNIIGSIENPFSYCNINDVSFGENITSIPGGLFQSVEFGEDTIIIVPSNINSIGGSLFANSSGIKKVDLSNSNIKSFTGGSEFYHCNVSEVILPDGLTSIGSSSFSNCKNIVDITIPNSVKTIGSSAFYKCTSLRKIIIPDGATTIGRSAFSQCLDLSEVKIPSSVTTIGENAFSLCDADLVMYVVKGSTAYNYAIDNGLSYELYTETGEEPEDDPEITPDDAFVWNGTIITGYTGSYIEISIPAKTTAIGDEAFRGSSITKVRFLGNKVTEIGRYAFAESELQSIVLPDSLKVINNYAFYDTKLSKISIPANVEKINIRAFSAKDDYSSGTMTKLTFEGNKLVRIGDYAFYNQKIGNLDLPESLAAIGSYAFRGNKISSLTITKNVTSIGEECFAYCNSLTEINIDSIKISSAYNPFIGDRYISSISFALGTTVIPNRMFYTYERYISPVTVSIPASVKEIGEYAFSGVGNIEVIFEGNNVETIGYNAFSNCNFIDFSIPSSVKVIGSSAFSGCANMKSLVLPFGIEGINGALFSGCQSLEEIRIPEGVKYIYGSAFSNCIELSKVYIPSSVKTIYDSFNNVDIDFTMYVVRNSYAHYYAKENNIPFAFYDESEYVDEQFKWSGTTITKYIGSSTVVSIPARATAIGKDAFSGTGVTSVTFLGDKVTSIGNSAFSGCQIREIDIPLSVKTIGSSAFNWCSYLEEITIPGSVTEIGSYAFYYCTNLSKVTISSNVKKIGDGAFSGCSSDLIMYVTSGSAAYDYAVKNKIDIAATYHIYYKLDGGTNNPANIDVWEKDDETTLLEPSRGGYSFAGWYYDSTFKRPVNGPVNCTGDLTVYAKWNMERYTITYVYNGGSMTLNPTSYNVTSSIKLANPSKPSSTFAGWYDENGNKVTTIAKGTYGNLVLSAEWTEYAYTVKYNANGGLGYMDTQTFNYSEEKSLLENAFVRTGYTFTGWNTAANGKGDGFFDREVVAGLSEKDKATVNLYAQWELVEYSIIYELNGGEQNPKNPDIYDTSKAVTLNSPTKTGYTFTGWFKNDALSGAKVTSVKKGSEGDLSLYAGWKENTYRIVFSKNGSGAVGDIANVNADYSADIELPDLDSLTRQGYTLTGWNTKANGTGDAYLCGETVNSLVSKNNGSITLYAQWSADEHVITYINTEDADNTANPDKCTVESKISLKAPKKEGYTFEGWYENSAFEGKKISSLSKVTEDKDLFAKWSENKYKVAFNKNGGKITAGSLPAASEYLYTANVELPDETVATLERYGYTLTGFNTKANGTGIHYDLGSTESSMTSVNRQTVTLYAEWTIDEYDVNYILDGGTNNAANPDHHTAVSVVTLKNPVKEGYTFAGWYTDEDFTAANKVTKINKSEDEVTLYAKWTENVYKISYNKNGGNIVSGNLPPTSDYIPYTEEVDIPDSETVILERYGYTLTGYNTKANGTGTHFDLGSTVSGIASANKKTVTLYAEWTVDKYDVDYNLDGGINNEANTDYHTAVSDLVLKNPVKTGYTFKGWFKDSDYSAAGKITKVVRSEEAATVYAKWQVNSYSVIFNRNGGTGAMASLKENYDVTYDLPANAFTRNGYRFVEWNTKANGTGTGYANEESVSNLVSQNGGRITLYAIWEKD